MRVLTSHMVVSDGAPQLNVLVADAPGPGGANHRYEITGFNSRDNASESADPGYKCAFNSTTVLFQNGPIKEVGVNGITAEALLAILIDRLECFQSGPFACAENNVALQHGYRMLAALQTRTIERIKRQVEGTNAV